MKPIPWLAVVAVAALSGCMPPYQRDGQPLTYDDHKACNQEAFASPTVGWIRGNPLAFIYQDEIMAAFDVCIKRKGYVCKPGGDMAKCP